MDTLPTPSQTSDTNVRRMINKDFDKTIKILVREVAAGIDGMSASPLMNTNRKGEAFPIMLQ